MLLSTYFIFHVFLKIRLELYKAVMLCRSMKKDDILKDFQKGNGFPWLPSVFLKLASYLSLGKIIFYLRA